MSVPIRRTWKAAVAQFCATEDVAGNLETCRSLLREAKGMGADFAFLPEASDFVSRGREETVRLTQEAEQKFLGHLADDARRLGLWVAVGVHEKSSEPARVFNSHVLISGETGKVTAVYRKLHLFDLDVEGGPRMLESESTMRGASIVDPVPTPFGNIGLTICYDIRFPELSQSLRRRGAHVLTYPAAFTTATGEAHWEVLIRARAIETQTYVIAAAQSGKHNENRDSYGNAMICDPWGRIVASCPARGAAPTVAVGNVNYSELDRVRKAMPVLEHRRVDLFPEPTVAVAASDPQRP